MGRKGTNYFGNIGSPSKQVKRKAVQLRNFIKKRFKISPYIHGLVVFTNKDVKLTLNNPTVNALKPQELCEFIQNMSSKRFNDEKLRELQATLKQYSHFS